MKMISVTVVFIDQLMEASFRPVFSGLLSVQNRFLYIGTCFVLMPDTRRRLITSDGVSIFYILCSILPDTTT